MLEKDIFKRIDEDFLEIRKDLIESSNKDFIDYVKNLCLYRLSFLGHIENKPEYKKKVFEIVDKFDVEYNIKRKENEIIFPKKFKKARDLILSFEEKDKVHLENIIESIKDFKK